MHIEESRVKGQERGTGTLIFIHAASNSAIPLITKELSASDLHRRPWRPLRVIGSNRAYASVENAVEDQVQRRRDCSIL